ncbi:hypothetical protein Tco_0624597 [Tanacetum coccineum]|uniref:Integrase, catalytic region, zinc finger, CCHC-type, peptidase aspartic, catalytic n=1 Tax=Tanacetum coccineum TaxID=301880 RepID=A0ABQ4WEJ3_9ASTR
MTTLADKSLLSGGDNKPPMLEKHLYDSWKSRMELYMMNRPHGRMILASVEKGPLVWPSITEDGVTRLKEYVELTPAEAIQADCDIKAINIILQGLPTEIYALVSQHRVAKDLWEKIKLLMQGTSLTKQERECKLYDEFDKFTYKKGETLHEYYLRFTLLLNDMNIYKMPLEQFQVNTKFLNTLPDEWSKFVTDVKLVKDLHTTNVDQLHAYLQQHERHANEVRLMHARNSDPLALVASHQLTQPAYQSHLHTHPGKIVFSLLLNDMNIYNMKLEQFQVNTKFLNTLPPEWSKFVTDVKLVRDLHTTNIDQLHAYLGQHEFHANEVRLMHERNSDPLALVATHQMTQSPYQTHQNSYQNTQFQPQVSPYQSPQYGSPYQSQQYSTHQSSTPLSISYPSNDYQSSIHHNVYSPSSSIPQLEYAPTVNQQPEFSQPDSGLIVLVFQKGDDPIDAINHIMSFLTVVVTSRYPTTNNQLRNSSNPRKQDTINNGRVTLQPIQGRQTGRPHVQLNTAKVALMANLSHYGSDALAEYVIESQQASVQNSNSYAQQDALILSVIEQLKTQVVNCTKINLENKSVNDTLTAELERYKEQVKVLKEGQNVDLRSNDNVSNSSAQSVEIDRLKQTLFEHLKEKETLMQTVTLHKNDFKKEESRNIDREIALENKIKQLDNIFFKRDQSAFSRA